ncbi:hypothetical protein J6590_065633 [Homalodisca vitripennis]|nr:hypothetical protein J6590_065633 [Homalodisca vitripennis]
MLLTRFPLRRNLSVLLEHPEYRGGGVREGGSLDKDLLGTDSNQNLCTHLVTSYPSPTHSTISSTFPIPIQIFESYTWFP